MQDTLHPSFISTKNLRTPLQNLLETATFYTFFLVLTLDEVCNILNKYRSPSNLPTHCYFYTQDFITLLHLENTFGAPRRKPFLKHPLFNDFSLLLTVSKVCNTANNKTLKKTLPSIQKKLRCPSQKLLETSPIYHIFTSFHGG